MYIPPWAVDGLSVAGSPAHVYQKLMMLGEQEVRLTIPSYGRDGLLPTRQCEDWNMSQLRRGIHMCDNNHSWCVGEQQAATTSMHGGCQSTNPGKLLS